MSSIITGNAQQYSDSQKLAARARLNQNYTIAELPWFPWVGRQLAVQPGEHVLDVGCGPAWFWATIAETLPEDLSLTLADQSAGMVAEAAERAKTLPCAAEAVQADAAALPFADASFDVVVAMHMLYHLPDPAVAIAEMHRVLKPGGRLVVTTNGIGNMAEMYALTTVFGSAPVDPAAIAFGYDKAERLLRERFGNVEMREHPAGMRVTSEEDVYLALTSYPPGDRAEPAELAAFREAIGRAFAAGGGALEVKKQSAVFISRRN